MTEKDKKTIDRSFANAKAKMKNTAADWDKIIDWADSYWRRHEGTVDYLAEKLNDLEVCMNGI